MTQRIRQSEDKTREEQRVYWEKERQMKNQGEIMLDRCIYRD